MNIRDLATLFEKHKEEYLEFKRVENRRSNRHDVHAFILLNEICPLRKGGGTLLASCRHDEIFFDLSLEDLCKAKINESQVIELIRSGVRLSDGMLAMFI